MLIANFWFPTIVKLCPRRVEPLIEMLSQLVAKICRVIPRFRADFWLGGRVELTTEPLPVFGNVRNGDTSLCVTWNRKPTLIE